MKEMLIAFLLFAGTAMAAAQIETHLSCEGNCSFVQTTNNRTIEIESNESLVVETHTEADETSVETNISANATGAGTAKIEQESGEFSYESTVDGEKMEKSGTGILSALFSFLRGFDLLGWFGEKL